MCDANLKKFILPSDYDGSIAKLFEKRNSGSRHLIFHSLDKKKQSIEPLVVLDEEQQGLTFSFENI
jgi:hypothetical protein